MPDRETGFVQRTRLIVEPGSIARVAEQAALLGMEKAVAIMDPALADSELTTAVVDLVGKERVLVRTGVEPTFDTVAAATAELAALGADGVIAVGGGSTIDTAKLARGLLAGGLTSLAELPDELEGVAPLIACPTTAGTGAEVGAGAVVYSPLADDKILIRRQALAADVVVADANLTLGLPSHLTAFTGLDAFAQALMAYAPAGPDAISGQVGLRAMRLIWSSLPTAVADGSNAQARAEMMLGSVMSALAMFNAPPVYAGEHVFAEPVGAAVKCHHGHAVAAFLPATAEFNLEPFRPRYAEVARELGLGRDGDSEQALAHTFPAALRKLVLSLGVPPLGEAMEDYDLDDLVRRCVANEAFALNPRVILEDDARQILRSGIDGTFQLAGAAAA